MQLTLANTSVKLILISYLFQGIDITLLWGILVVIVVYHMKTQIYLLPQCFASMVLFQVSLALSLGEAV